LGNLTSEEEYRRLYTFGLDYGTSHFKFGPITCGEVPQITENRGYFPDKESIMYRAFEIPKEVIVGNDIPLYLQSSEDLSSRLIHPMRNGVIEKDDEKAWKIVEEISRYALNIFKPTDENFDGFYLVSSLSSVSPRYMYEHLFEIYKRITEEDGTIKAVTVIPQPLAVAIAHKATTCVVVESGHGNTQVCPISRYPIRNAIVAINRGGGDANALTTEILKDLGYADLTNQESFIRAVKEKVGLIPINLHDAVEASKKDKKRFQIKFKIPGTRIVIEFDENAWTRFLIGEYIFNPNHEIYKSYFTRGMAKPRDVRVGNTIFRGMIDFGESVLDSVERCPIELQPHLYSQILLSGGNFNWTPPENLKDIATDSPTKILSLLRTWKIKNVKTTMAESPQNSVWRGCVIYGYAVPINYEWTWEKMEGWKKFLE
jgi:crenactin